MGWGKQEMRDGNADECESSSTYHDFAGNDKALEDDITRRRAGQKRAKRRNLLAWHGSRKGIWDAEGSVRMYVCMCGKASVCGQIKKENPPRKRVRGVCSERQMVGQSAPSHHPSLG